MKNLWFVLLIVSTGTSAPFLKQIDNPLPHYVWMTADISPVICADENLPPPISAFLPLVIDSFPSPDTAPFGLEWINGKLWHSDLRTQTIYQLDPNNGSVLRSFYAPDQWSKDLAFDGSYLFVCGNYQSAIYKIDTINGSLIGSFLAPGSNPVGLCFDGTYLWNADLNSDQSQPNYIYKLNPLNGQVISSIITPAEWPAGLAWDNGYIWNVDMKNKVIYKINPNNGEVVKAVGTPGTMPTGLALGNSKLWNADWDRATIYSFAPDSGPSIVMLNQPHNLDVLPCWRNVAIVGTVNGSDLQHYTVEYGIGENPSSWNQIGNQHTTPVFLDTLESWDVSGITEANIYQLRIEAVFSSHIDTLNRIKINLDPQILPGWPQTFVNASNIGAADINRDSLTEIFAGLNHQDFFNQRLAAWNLAGTVLPGFPVIGINNNQMAPGFGDMLHNNETSIITGYDLNNNQVHITRSNGSNFPGWPQNGGQPGNLSYLGLPVLADINGDSMLEVFTGGSTLSAWNSSGTMLSGFPKNLQSSSPAIGDINRDGHPELVVLSADSIIVYDKNGTIIPGFPKRYGGSSIEQYPVLGDINQDQQLEIIFNLSTRLFAVDDTGGVLIGFPKNLAGSYANSPLLGDIDLDGYPEIIVVSGTFPNYSEIGAFHHDGFSVSGFPKRLNDRIFRAFNEPVLGDVNGDSFPEIVMGFEVENTFEEVHAWRNNGNEVSGWPKRLRDIYGYGITGSPVLGDFDADSDLEMAVSSNAYWMASTDIYVWDLEQPFIADAMPWPTQRQNNQRTANLGNVPIGITESSPTKNSMPKFTAYPNPFRQNVTFSWSNLDLQSLNIYDAMGRLVTNSQPLPTSHRFVWDGRDDLGRQVSPGVYFIRFETDDFKQIEKIIRSR
jgi:glutamine cyclotransferase